nr:hypothetical protein [uncultured Prevotella sp.]
MMTTAKLKPAPTSAIDEQGYYILGDANGWDGDTDMTYNAEERFFTT